MAVEPGLGPAWGLGWGVERKPDDVCIWQWGNNTGYRAFVIASVRTGDGFVMLTNSGNGLNLAENPAQRFAVSVAHAGGDILTSFCNTVRVCL